MGKLLAEPFAGVDGVEFDVAEGIARDFLAGRLHFLDDGFHAGTLGDEDIYVVVVIHDGLEALRLGLNVDLHFRDKDGVHLFAGSFRPISSAHSRLSSRLW